MYKVSLPSTVSCSVSKGGLIIENIIIIIIIKHFYL